MPRPYDLLLDRCWRHRYGYCVVFAGFRALLADSVRKVSPPAPAPYEDELLAWGKFFLPHHFKQPPSKMHREIAAILDASISPRPLGGEGPGARGQNQAGDPPDTPALKLNLLAPRASAKSTLVTLAHVLREALTARHPYIWIISDTKRQAVAHLDNVYAELKDNDLFHSFYPRSQRLIKTAGRITLDGVAIEAYGAGQRLRGHRWRERRPTLIICDDLQNDGHIRSPTQRDRSRTWFHSMLMKAGTKRTEIINLGTALHREALSLELHTTPGWLSRKYQAITEWPINMQLWAEWEGLYRSAECGVRSAESGHAIDPSGVVAISPGSRPHDPGGVAAISPGSRSAPGVSERTESSRPRQGSQRADETDSAGIPSGCESMSYTTDRGCRCAQPPANGCDPSGINASPGETLPQITSSPPHLFTSSSQNQLAHDFYNAHRDEMELGAQLLWKEEEDLYTLMCMRAEGGPAAFEREKQCVPLNPEECEWPETYFTDAIWFDRWPTDLRVKTIALDPSKGADSKHGDYSAFVMFAVAGDGTLYVDANLARRPTPQIVTDGVELIKRFQPQGFGVETNQFQSLLAAEFSQEFQRQQLIGIRAFTLDNHLAKAVRIRRLGPLLAARQLRFKSNSPGAKLLVEQLREFPLAKHDDGPDALEMALRLAENLVQPTPTDGLGNRMIWY